ncbi:Hsp20/alpha crystallin family protein [Haladaptatus sp. GCM10025707]|uniref:Hsp20/alpha crystallin family protein n=1 Tax=unclassified Haladaptatus TaxID=2622732 RepID=UPI00361DC5A2
MSVTYHAIQRPIRRDGPPDGTDARTHDALAVLGHGGRRLRRQLPQHGWQPDPETDEEGYVVLGDMPGFEKEEIDIRFDKGVLTVTGTHEVESEYASQRRQVHEQLTIPGEIREADITASYRNGVLEIHLPTVEDMDDDSHRIEISD